MKNLIVKTRNKTGETLYKHGLKHLLFLTNPEKIHHLFTQTGRVLGSNILTRGLVNLSFNYKNKKLRQKLLGIKFENPIGLAAGYDKNAQCINVMGSVGFGFVEVGSITARPCKGNKGPRLWRLKKSGALVVNYGLNNKGALKLSKQLKGKKHNIPVGTNIAMTNSKQCCTLKGGIQDYVYSYKKFANIGAYFTINISCPNAFGGENFLNPQRLDKLLKEIFKIKKTKPVFIKLACDTTQKEVSEILDVCDKYPLLDGLIISNLTKNRNNIKIKEKKVPQIGGISGSPTRDLSTNLIKYVYKKTKGKYLIIGCGGIFTAQDAYQKIKAGASLVQLFTGMIYQGPWAIAEINRGLVELLELDGLKNISQAVGIDVYNQRRIKFRYKL